MLKVDAVTSATSTGSTPPSPIVRLRLKRRPAPKSVSDVVASRHRRKSAVSRSSSSFVDSSWRRTLTTRSPSGSGRLGHSISEMNANAAAPMAIAKASDAVPTSVSTG